MNSSLIFVLGAGALTAGVLAVLLPPLWRDLSSRGAALVLAAGIPLLAASLYAARGQPQAWEASARAPVAPAGEDLEALAGQMLQRFEAGARATMAQGVTPPALTTGPAPPAR